MKPTPLYEIAVATKDRPKTFRLIVIGSFITSLLIIIVCAGVLLTEQKSNAQGAVTSSQKKIQHNRHTAAPDLAVK